MKKLIPFIISGVLVIGAVGCTPKTPNNAEAPGTTNEAAAPAKEASQTTTGKATTATTTKVAETGLAGEVSKKLKDSLPGSNLSTEIKDGVVTVKGTVPSEAELKKIQPLVSKLKGVKSVKVEAKVASVKKAQ